MDIEDYEREKAEKKLLMKFPESAVLLLRHNGKTLDEYNIKIMMPDGVNVDYIVSVVKGKTIQRKIYTTNGVV